MPIFIKESREPFSGGPWRKGTNFAKSEAYYLLCRELERYALGDLSGRSFLICGHRGSGKTTLVLKAIEDTQIKLLNSAVRLLLVRLPGPDLLSPPTEDPKTNNTDQPFLSLPQHAAVNLDTSRQRFLKLVTSSVYRAAAEEICDSFRRRVYAGEPDPSLDSLEPAAQLWVEMDETPDLAQLREFWDRAGFLEHGVLFPTTSPRPSDQGMRELIALFSAVQAYRRVIGTEKAERTITTAASHKQSLAIQTVSEIKNALHPLFGLLAGGTVGLGLEHETGRGFLSALVGTATGLGTAIALNYSASRSRDTSRTSNVTFLPDTSVTSLGHILPLLVERFRSAGLVPVFVMDELDKVEDLSNRMEGMVNDLKQFVTERTFFCFLADRNYIERLRRLFVSKTYPKEYTYFSHRLFVVHRPRNLHEYLNSVLEVSETTTPEEASGDAVDRDVLRYVLLHRSSLHPYDLRGEITRIRNERGAVSLERGAVRSQLSYRFDLLIQLAVEYLLDEPVLKGRLTQDPEFTQLAHDTLYYPSRKWLLGEADLNISRAALSEYWADRMSPHRAPPATPGLTRSFPPNPAQAASASGDTEESYLTEPDKEFLHTQLRQLVGLLSNPAVLRAELKRRDPTISETVMAALPENPPLRRKESRQDIYIWVYDVYGRMVRAPQEEVKEETRVQEVERVRSELGGKRNLIGSVADLVAGLTNGVISLERLAVEFGVLKTTPAWSPVQTALTRLERLSRIAEPYAEMQQDDAVVSEYATMLERSGETLALGLVCAKILGRMTTGDEASQVLFGLAVLARELGLLKCSEEDTRSKLSSLMDSFFRLSSQLQSSVPVLKQGAEEAWRQGLKNGFLQAAQADKFDPAMSEAYRATSLKTWRGRFTRLFQDGTTEFPATAEDLLWAASPNAGVLKVDLGEMTLADWTWVLRSSVEGPTALALGAELPALFAVPALAQLGFTSVAAQCAYYRILRATDPVEDQTTMSEWSGLLQMSQKGANEGRRSVLILVTPADALLTTTWKPSRRWAAFCWYGISTWFDLYVVLERLVSRLNAAKGGGTPPEVSPSLDVKRDLGIDMALVELAGDDQSIAQQLALPAATLLQPPVPSGLSWVYIIPRAPVTTGPFAEPFVVAPRSLDDAMERSTLRRADSARES